MKREYIEKAARIEREKINNELQEGYKNHKDINLYIAFSSTVDKYAIPLFIAGADWRINSVWHDVSEKPQKNDVHIAVLNKYGIKTDFWCDFCGWEKYVRLDKIEKWAYIKDLIPNTED